MAEFYTSLSKIEIATQIATMINKYNKWYCLFSAAKVMKTMSNYFIEVYGDKVVGCSSYIQDFNDYTKIQHICVLPEYRNFGIAKKLTNLVINQINTEFIYMTIREDNTPSINLAKSLNFNYIKKHRFIDHWTLTFGRRK